MTRKLSLGECEVPTGLNGGKCSLFFLGQVSVSGAQAGLGPRCWLDSSREQRWSRQSSQTTDVWLTLQELTLQSPNRDVLPVFDRTRFPSARTASSESNRKPFHSQITLSSQFLPSPVGHSMADNSQNQVFDPTALETITRGAARGDVQRF